MLAILITHISVFLLSGCFIFLTTRNFGLALKLFIILLPSYLVRFDLGPGLPSTALEVIFGSIALGWLVKYSSSDFLNIRKFFSTNKIFTIFFGLFFVSSIIGIFISDMWWYSFGQWRAYFLEPMFFLIILIGRGKEIDTKAYLDGFVYSSLSVSILAVAQKLFGFGLDESGRSLSFFTSPNAVGLYLAPLAVLVGCKILEQISTSKFYEIFYRKEIWIFLVAFTAIIFTKSLGTVFGLVLAAPFVLYIFGYRREAAAFVVALIFAVTLVVKSFGLSVQKTQSLDNRLTLWRLTSTYLTESPKNFIFGTGIRQYFRKVQKPHYEPKELERLIYPHNIFLNFWTEIGLVGATSFAGMFFYLAWLSKKMFHKKHIVAAAMSLGVLVVILAHGLIDVPYFKNDLSLMFWILTAFIFKNSEAV